MELRFHRVIAVPRGAKTEEDIQTLYDGPSFAGEARKAYEEAAKSDPKEIETIAIFEHCTPRTVYHLPLPPVAEPPAPKPAAEVKQPAPETTLKPKPPPPPPPVHHESHGKGKGRY
jgi:hypothetical protein